MSTSARRWVADVAVDVRAGGSRAVWTYSCEPGLPLGEALLVPLGSRKVLGNVVAVREATETELGFPFSQLRSYDSRVDGLALPPQLIQTLVYAAEEYLCPISVALSAVNTPGLRERLVTTWSLVPGATRTDLTRLQSEALEAIVAAGGVLTEDPKRKFAPSLVRALRLLAEKGLVQRRVALGQTAERRKDLGLLMLSPDSDLIERFLQHGGKRKPSQALTLMRLQGAGPNALTAAEIRALCGVSDQTLRALISANLLVQVEAGTTRRIPAPKPNEEQAAAIEKISGALKAKRFEPFLLFGVTGSGKTEVFLRCASEALAAGRQVLYLVPEIALAAQAISQLRGRFGDRVVVLHSELTPVERQKNWLAVGQGQSPVVLGPRSALFAPLGNIGLIIVDEEHETSYKQESAPRYHTKRLALKLAGEHKAAIVFGSATPSIETYSEAKEGRIRLLTLTRRAAAATMPKVHVDDLSACFRQGKPAILAPMLHDRLEQVLERQEQAILFLNRRAYAPFLICRDCGHQFHCPRCSVSLAFSRKLGILRCHHCDHREKPPDVCPQCQGTRLNPFGVGTERVEEAVRELFPSARVARLDRDIASRKGALEEILTGFRGGDLDVLVGTQMVAKGLDFPRVTLVGVIAADVSLNFPDFRASERTFQLLSQVAGRAGRGAHPGEVVIQTFNPTHVSVTHAQDHNFPALFEALRVEREAAGYPPYRRLVNVLFSGENWEMVREASSRAALALQGLDVEILGPADAAIERLHNRWRRHFLVKLPTDAGVAEIGERLRHCESKGVLMVIDVDPYSMV